MGLEYVLFADDWQRGPLEIGTPTNSGTISKRHKTLAAIARVRQARRGGEMTGKVFFENGPVKTPSVQVNVTGTANYSALTDKNGRFRIATIPGEYKLQANPDGWLFSPPDFSYENIDHIKIQNGQCADVWLYATPQKKSAAAYK